MMNPAEFASIARSEETLWWYRGMRRILWRILGPAAASRRIEHVLEAGCGTGAMSRAMADRYGWRLTPLDYSHVGLAYAQSMGLDRLVQGDIQALPFSDASFDAVVSLDVVVHLPQGAEDTAWREFARVVKPGGLVVVRVSALDILRSRHSIHAEERQRFTKARLRAGLERAGLRVARITYANSLLLPIALFKFRVWEPLTGAPPASGVEPLPPWLDSLLYAPLALEDGLIGGGFNLPLGQSLIAVADRPSAAL